MSASRDHDDASRAIPLPLLLELRLSLETMARRRAELENAELRHELTLRATLEALGLSGRNVRVDLDRGVATLAERLRSTGD